MAKKLDTQGFIVRAKAIHGDKYDYSLVEYFKYRIPVKIICQAHGEFEQDPNTHLGGGGCPECANHIRAGYPRTNEGFAAKSQTIHGDRYDYSKVEYVNNRTKVTIICPDHGEFEQMPFNHTQGKGCPECARLRITEKTKARVRVTTSEWVSRAKRVHGDRYDYSKSVYTKSDEKVAITCPVHGIFHQMANNHIHLKAGCPECANEARKAPRKAKCQKSNQPLIDARLLGIFL